MNNKVIDSIEGFGSFSIVDPNGNVKSTHDFTNTVSQAFKNRITDGMSVSHDGTTGIRSGTATDNSACYIRITVGTDDYSGTAQYVESMKQWRLNQQAGSIGEVRIRSIAALDNVGVDAQGNVDGTYGLNDLALSAGVRWIPDNASVFRACRSNRRYQDETELTDSDWAEHTFTEANGGATATPLFTSDWRNNLDFRAGYTYTDNLMTHPMDIGKEDINPILRDDNDDPILDNNNNTQLVSPENQKNEIVYDHYATPGAVEDDEANRPRVGSSHWFPFWYATELPNVSGSIGFNTGVFSTIRCNLGGNSYILSSGTFGDEWYRLDGGATSFSHYWCFKHTNQITADQYITTPASNATTTGYMSSHVTSAGNVVLNSGYAARDRNVDEGKVVLVELLNGSFESIAGFAPAAGAGLMDKNDNFYVEYKVKFEIPVPVPVGSGEPNINYLRIAESAHTTRGAYDLTMGSSNLTNTPASSLWRVGFVDRLARIFNPVNTRGISYLPDLYRSGNWRNESPASGGGQHTYNYQVDALGNDAEFLLNSDYKMRDLEILGVSVHSVPRLPAGTDGDDDITQNAQINLNATAEKLSIIHPLYNPSTWDNGPITPRRNAQGVIADWAKSADIIDVGTYNLDNSVGWEFFYNPKLSWKLDEGSTPSYAVRTGYTSDEQTILNGTPALTTVAAIKTADKTAYAPGNTKVGGRFGHSITSNFSPLGIVVGSDGSNSNIALTAETGTDFTEQPRWYRIWFGRVDSIFNPSIDDDDFSGLAFPTLFLVNTENVLLEGRIATVEGDNASWTKNDTLSLTWNISVPA